VFAQTSATGLGLDFSTARSEGVQRFYNYLCIAYAAEPAVFGWLVKNGTLPEERMRFCRQDYVRLANSFNAVFMPHVDEELLKKVQAMQWIQPPGR
jgi:hypothetical protein